MYYYIIIFVKRLQGIYLLLIHHQADNNLNRVVGFFKKRKAYLLIFRRKIGKYVFSFLINQRLP